MHRPTVRRASIDSRSTGVSINRAAELLVDMGTVWTQLENPVQNIAASAQFPYGAVADAACCTADQRLLQVPGYS